MPIRKRRDLDGDEPRRLYGFIDSVVGAMEGNPYSRAALVIDAVDADAFDADAAAITDEKSLYLIRVVTTPNRLRDFLTRVPDETDWLGISLGRRPNSPCAWVLPGTAGTFGSPFRTNVTEITAGAGLGATRLSALKAASRVANVTTISPPDPLQFAAFTHPDPTMRIMALDVGQASCNAVYAKGQCVGYFDVGAPISFNGKSFPRRFHHTASTKGFVLLSHWDFDHYALAYKIPALRALQWYAPDQPVGPRTAMFQRSLGARLTFLSGDVIAGALSLCQCLGPSGNRNTSGYALRLQLGSQAVLMTGDADYAWVPPSLLGGLTATVVPHHGGDGSGPPPTPAAWSHPVAVASYGTPNRYRHPSETRLTDHETQGWILRRTAKHGDNPIVPRGSRKLYPLP